jgi:hypothetical protein
MSGWTGVDLDGTLAEYGGWQGEDHIGAPIPVMIERVKRWIAEGREVRIFTARVQEPCSDEVIATIQAWCERHIGCVLPITNQKDYDMVALWDDRCVQVECNTGRRMDGGD